jgi:hypothetical protein
VALVHTLPSQVQAYAYSVLLANTQVRPEQRYAQTVPLALRLRSSAQAHVNRITPIIGLNIHAPLRSMAMEQTSRAWRVPRTLVSIVSPVQTIYVVCQDIVYAILDTSVRMDLDIQGGTCPALEGI